MTYTSSSESLLSPPEKESSNSILVTHELSSLTGTEFSFHVFFSKHKHLPDVDLCLISKTKKVEVNIPHSKQNP